MTTGLDAVLESSPDAVITMDDEGRVLALNSAAERMFLMSAADACGRLAAQTIVAPRLREAHAGRLRGLRDGGDGDASGFTRTRLQSQALRGDGSQFPVEVTLTRTSESPARVVAWVRDLTDLQAEGNRRRALLESAEEITESGSWEWIPSEGHLLWSDNLYRIFGLIPGEQTPSPDLALERTHPADRAILAAAFENLERGHLAPVAYRIVRDDGTTRYVRATPAVAERRDGRPHRMVGSLQDLTDRRCAEQAIAAHVSVAEALAGWQSLDRDAERLLANLATALGYTAAVLWVPDRDALAARVAWHDGREPEVSRYVTAARRARLRRGAGLPGRAWQHGEPVEAGEAGEAGERGESDGEQQGPGTTVAIPALFGEEVVAVIELKATHHARLTPHLLRSLTGLGHELGHFLWRRRGDLNAPLLTSRELDVLRLAASGLSANATAASLSLSPSTVKTHLDKSYMKLRVSSKAEAVAQALRRGLIE